MTSESPGSTISEPATTDLRAFLVWLAPDNQLESEAEGAGPNGSAYAAAHRRLTLFFASRQCLEPETLADQTLDVAMRKVAEIPPEAQPLAYLIGVAKNVHRDDLREQQREEVCRQVSGSLIAPPEAGELETRHTCLESCLAELPAAERTLVLAYYRESKQQKIDVRKELADRAGLTLNALRNRVFRLNQRLALCVTDCLAHNAA